MLQTNIEAFKNGVISVSEERFEIDHVAFFKLAKSVRGDRYTILTMIPLHRLIRIKLMLIIMIV